jgi:hypothetical protein
MCTTLHPAQYGKAIAPYGSNGMVEGMNKKVKAIFHYGSVGELKTHLYHYMSNYNFNLKLRAIGRKIPFDAVLQWYDKKPDIFLVNTSHLYVGLNTYQATLSIQF